MKIECKLMIWLAIFLAGCAGSNSSLKDDMLGKTLVKANSVVADSLLAKMPSFAQSVFKGVVDSVPGDYYYSVAEGRIDSLYNLKDGRYERNAGIRYADSGHYVVSRIEIRAGEMSACKVYQGENLIREYQKGKSYRLFDADSVLEIQGDVRLVNMDNDSITCIKCVSNFRLKDSEKLNSTIEAESYTGDAKNFKFVINMNVKLDVKINRDSVKQYNDQGVLIKDLLFPKYLRDYYDNGNLKYEWVGELYRNEKGMVDVDNGYNKGYYEDGRIMAEAEYKNKKKVSEKYWNVKGDLVKEMYYDRLGRVLVEKDWNGNGVLVMDMKSPEYYREFYSDGKIKVDATGIYVDSLNNVSGENGFMKRFYENGQMEMFMNFKDQKGYSFQSWYENGTLQAEGEVSSGSHKEFHQNGKTSREVKGKFYYGQNGELNLTEGTDKTWSYQGKPLRDYSTDSSGMAVSEKVWNSAGVLISDTKMPETFKAYWDDGKPKEDVKGKLYYGANHEVLLDSGEYKSFYPNGGKECVAIYKNKFLVDSKNWNNNGILISDAQYDDRGRVVSAKGWNDKGALESVVDFPTSMKTYFENGALESETQGVLYYTFFGQIQLKDGTYKSYYEDGSWHSVITMKNGLYRKLQSRVDALGKEIVYEVDYDTLGVENAYKLTKEGILEVERFGVLYKDSAEVGYSVDTGYEKFFHKSGKVRTRIEYDHKKLVNKKEWDEQEHLIVDVHIPDYYREYDVDGKLMQEAVGVIEEENSSFKVKEGVVKVFDADGKVNYSATYKDYQVVSEGNGE